MFKFVVLATLVTLASAKPGYLHSAPAPVAEEFYSDFPYPVVQEAYGAYAAPFAPAHVAVAKHVLPAAPVAVGVAKHVVAAPIAIAKQVVAVTEPQDVSYSRTEVISRKITANAPNAAYIGGGPVEGFLDGAVPHAVKNVHYAEENIVSGPPGSRREEAGSPVEANFRSINVEIPQAPEVEVRNGQSDPQRYSVPPAPAQSQPQPQMQEYSQPQREAEPQPQAYSQPQYQPQPQPQPQAYSQPQYQPQPQPQMQQYSQPQSQPEPQPQDAAPQFRASQPHPASPPSQSPQFREAQQYIPPAVEYPAPQLQPTPAPAQDNHEVSVTPVPFAHLRSSVIAPAAAAVTYANAIPAARIAEFSKTYLAPDVAGHGYSIHTPAVAYAAAPAPVHFSYAAPAPVTTAAYVAPAAAVTKVHTPAFAYTTGPVAYSSPAIARIHAPAALAYSAPVTAAPLAYAEGPAIVQKTVSVQSAPILSQIYHGPEAISKYY